MAGATGRGGAGLMDSDLANSSIFGKGTTAGLVLAVLAEGVALRVVSVSYTHLDVYKRQP